MASTNPARGTRDFLPVDVRKREYVINIIKEVYESYGFEPLETPAVENLETLMGKYGEEGNQLIFKILKRGEKLTEELRSYEVAKLQSSESSDAQMRDNFENALADLALRYDLTVPLARVAAHHKNELPKFFKRYQIQPVWRADRPARGRFREFYQCDVDAIGSSSLLIETELISAASEILTKLGFKDFIFRINHRELLRGIVAAAEINEAREADVFVAVDKLDKIGVEGVAKELESRGIGLRESTRLLAFLNNENGTRSLDAIASFVGENKRGKKGVSDLAEIVTLLGDTRIQVDPSLARGLSYYTGTIMEINVPDLAGSLGGGGRYDGLIGMFGKEQIPACGFSLGLERILVVMDERGMFPPEIAESSPADVMVTIWNEETVGESLKLAGELRAAGLRVAVYPEADKLGKQFKYASQINIPYVCVMGEIELAENKVTVKNMSTGEQQPMSQNEVIDRLRSSKQNSSFSFRNN